MGVEVLLNMVLFRKSMVDFVYIIWKIWFSREYSFSAAICYGGDKVAFFWVVFGYLLF